MYRSQAEWPVQGTPPQAASASVTDHNVEFHSQFPLPADTAFHIGQYHQCVHMGAPCSTHHHQHSLYADSPHTQTSSSSSHYSQSPAFGGQYLSCPARAEYQTPVREQNGYLPFSGGSLQPSFLQTHQSASPSLDGMMHQHMNNYVEPDLTQANFTSHHNAELCHDQGSNVVVGYATSDPYMTYAYNMSPAFAHETISGTDCSLPEPCTDPDCVEPKLECVLPNCNEPENCNGLICQVPIAECQTVASGHVTECDNQNCARTECRGCPRCTLDYQICFDPACQNLAISLPDGHHAYQQHHFIFNPSLDHRITQQMQAPECLATQFHQNQFGTEVRQHEGSCVCPLDTMIDHDARHCQRHIQSNTHRMVESNSIGIEQVDNRTTSWLDIISQRSEAKFSQAQSHTDSNLHVNISTIATLESKPGQTPASSPEEPQEAGVDTVASESDDEPVIETDRLTCAWKTLQADGVWKQCTEVTEKGKRMQTHIEHAHITQETKREQYPGDDDPAFYCHWAGCDRCCFKGFNAKPKLKRHMQIHSQHKPHKCNYPNCRTQMKTKDALDKHKRTHSGDKPYKCTVPECNRMFATSTEAKTHMTTHAGDKPHCCLECNERFADSSNLSKHKKTHYLGKFLCPEPDCNARMKRWDQIERHWSAHKHGLYGASDHGKKVYRQRMDRDHAALPEEQKRLLGKARETTTDELMDDIDEES